MEKGLKDLGTQNDMMLEWGTLWWQEYGAKCGKGLKDLETQNDMMLEWGT